MQILVVSVRFLIQLWLSIFLLVVVVVVDIFRVVVTLMGVDASYDRVIAGIVVMRVTVKKKFQDVSRLS